VGDVKSITGWLTSQISFCFTNRSNNREGEKLRKFDAIGRPVAQIPMKAPFSALFFAAGLTALICGGCASTPVAAPVTPPVAAMPAPAPTPIAAKIDFDKQVKPFFEEYCYQCHGRGRQSGGVRLDVKATALKHITAGDPTHSDVYRAITRSLNASDHMPPVSQEQPEDDDIAMIKQWIIEGAAWPDGS